MYTGANMIGDIIKPNKTCLWIEMMEIIIKRYLYVISYRYVNLNKAFVDGIGVNIAY